MKTFVMVDIETLSLKPNAVVLSIGAAAYNTQYGMIAEFEMFPALDEQIAKGRMIDGDTILWWFKQSQEARDNVANASRAPVATCGNAFNAWVDGVISLYARQPDNLFFVANGTDFDLPILSSLFDGYTTMPWDGRPGYRQKLCWRTLYNIYKNEIEWPINQAKHTALADAVSQAHAHLSLLRKRPYMV